MGPGPDWTLVPYANPRYATKFKPTKNIQLIPETEFRLGAAIAVERLRAADPDIV
jgi:hypothetical protein